MALTLVQFRKNSILTIFLLFSRPSLIEIKTKLVDEIKAAGLEYTVIATSAFYELWYTAITGFDAKNGKVSVLGDGNQKVSSTLTADIAKVTYKFLMFILFFSVRSWNFTRSTQQESNY